MSGHVVIEHVTEAKVAVEEFVYEAISQGYLKELLYSIYGMLEDTGDEYLQMPKQKDRTKFLDKLYKMADTCSVF